MDDPSTGWSLTGHDTDDAHDSLPFPTGGIESVRAKLDQEHDEIEDEVLASIQALKGDIDDINDILNQAIPFRALGNDDYDPAA